MKQMIRRLTFSPDYTALYPNDRCENLQDTYLLCVPIYFIIEPAGEFEQTIEVK
jgi:hypothetical protein